MPTPVQPPANKVKIEVPRVFKEAIYLPGIHEIPFQVSADILNQKFNSLRVYLNDSSNDPSLGNALFEMGSAQVNDFFEGWTKASNEVTDEKYVRDLYAQKPETVDRVLLAYGYRWRWVGDWVHDFTFADARTILERATTETRVDREEFRDDLRRLMNMFTDKYIDKG